jgi:type IV pilus assembly protein PilA
MKNLSIRKMNGLLKGKKTAFTLVELIIVIAIIAILAAIAIPKFGEIRENANVKADIANAKNIQTAATAAVSNGDITLPATGTVTVTIADVITGGATAVPVPKAKEAVAAGAANVFVATVDNKGVVVVTAGGLQVLPAPVAPYTD